MIRTECDMCQTVECYDRHELKGLKCSDGKYHCEECDNVLYVEFG